MFLWNITLSQKKIKGAEAEHRYQIFLFTHIRRNLMKQYNYNFLRITNMKVNGKLLINYKSQNDIFQQM